MSSGASGTVESLRHMLPELEVCAPDIPVDPAEALPYLRQYVEEQKPDIIVGTSMGAMYLCRFGLLRNYFFRVRGI